MPYKVKIIGAGSIGNHLANASRTIGWSVDLCDIDPAALTRTKEEIYPGRYKSWDDGIRLFLSREAPQGGYDFIFIGTPPDRHVKLALAALEERPRAILIEKPICTPDLDGAQNLFERSRELGIAAFAGYDHVVGQAAVHAAHIARSGDLGDVESLDVEFREHWGGILRAHPWLKGPADTYLGYWRRGGGAAGEHSHAANLWQHYARQVGKGRVTEVTATLDYVRDGTADYDRLCLLNLVTEAGLVGRVVQDVVTQPPRKMARVQGTDGFVEWHCGFEPGVDAVMTGTAQGEKLRELFKKTRPDDFIHELRHIEASLAAPDTSPISLERGLDTMMVVAAAHESAVQKRTIMIDHAHGYTRMALKAVGMD
jgi:predicted dehydrogenase